MGKNLFKKLLRDGAAKTREAPDELLQDVPVIPNSEQAAPIGQSPSIPALDDLSTRPAQPTAPAESGRDDTSRIPLDQVSLSPTEELAAKYIRPAVEMEDIEPLSDNYLEVIARETGLRLINLGDYKRPPTAILTLLTKEQAEKLVAIPVCEDEYGVVVIAIGDPSDPTVSDDLRTMIDREIETVIAKDEDIRDLIESYYGLDDETLEDIVGKAAVEESTKIEQSADVIQIETDVDALANAKPVVKLVNLLLVKAVKERASDIHIEPFPNMIRIRYRVDGVLREIPSPPRTMLAGITARVKIMARMDIAETRLPQDGRIKLGFEGREVDLRISSMPTVHGEAIVMRVLDKSMMMIGIGQIGLRDDVLDRFMHHINKPNGIVLVTGPTGCGKTTTLYAGLREINDPGEKLITVEDPVEFELDGLVQVNINDGIGLTFARTLRAILRQDPDKVLVGEIRDAETAQIAVQASLTGHLVFSTLHTNSAAATIIRLIDMGVPSFLITSALEAVLAQRLVRTICSHCRGPYEPFREEIDEFKLKPEDYQDQTFFQGQGCADCGHSGYRGRMGLFELLEMNDEIKEMILDQGTTDEINALAVRKGLVSMREDGWMKISLGLTTFEEVARETTAASEEETAAMEADTEKLEASEEPKSIEEPEAKTEALPEAPTPRPALDDKRMSVGGEEAAPLSDSKK